MRMFTGFFWGLLIITIIAVGCSQGSSPVDPCIKETVETNATPHSGSHNLWGLFTFICDPVTETVEIQPLRDAELHLNALKFLEPPVLVYLTLESPPEFNGNILDVDIGLRNPYLGFDQFTGFDVCGIVFTHGSYSGFHDPDIVMAGEGDTRLLNADGYTRWWNPVEFPHGDTIFNYKDGLLGTPADIADFNCTINGYKYFADGLEKDDPVKYLDPVERGAFRAGQKNVRHYKLDLSGGLIFNYAVDANWKQPTGGPPYEVPDDFPPGANRPEAYNSTFSMVIVDLFYNEYTGDAGGFIHLVVNVYDHYNVTLHKVHAESLAGLPYTTATGPYGDSDEFSTYVMDIPGDNLTQNGEIDILITVESEVFDYDGILPGKPVCAYFKITIDVPEGEIGDGWARTWGGTTNAPEYGLSAAVDAVGNVYVCGTTTGNVDFDPGPGENYQNEGRSFVIKLNSYGIYQWARSWDAEWAWGVAVDSSGNVFVSGGVNYDAYLRKYDANGELLWLYNWPQLHGFRVKVDADDNIYFTGRCSKSNYDLDPGPEIDIHSSGAFLMKFNSSGDYQWGRTFDGDTPLSLFTSGSICVYASGYFKGSVDLDPGPDIDQHESNGSVDVYLSKFNTDGDYLWGRTWGGSGLEQSYRGICDNSGNVYVVGFFSESVDFDPGPAEDNHTSNGFFDCFVCKFDEDGNYQWARTWGGEYNGDQPNYSDYCTAVGADNSGNIYVSGLFGGTVDFDPGTGVVERTSHGANDVFLLKLDSQGEFDWVQTFGGPGIDQGWGGTVTGSGVYYVTGSFEGTVNFKPGLWVDEHTSNGGFDVFLSKFPPDGNW